MGKIQVLDSALANQIAAGEVVERPSSVIKELIENSIDANSTRIIIKVVDAGKTLISVEDNGDGMDKDDAVLAFKRHATSKIRNTFDLFRIKTLGFRGEALPSISSVSHLTLVTSTGDGVGTKVCISEDNLHIEDASARKGTIITVEDLFYNTPARLKYMKADFTENANCVEVASKVALAHPNISFSLYINDRLQFQTTGRGDLLETIASIYGFDVARKMVPISFKTVDMEVSGFIGRPELARSNRYSMITLLNGRAVYLPKILTAIQDGYHDFIPPSRYPFVVLDLNVDFALVDVNVHPSKREVRFSKEEELRMLLLEKIPSILKESYKVVESTVTTNKVAEKEEKYVQQSLDIDSVKEVINDYVKNELPSEASLDSKEQTIVNDAPIINENATYNYVTTSKEFKHSPYRAVAQLQKSYIIAEDNEGGFVLVDQHAAQERINYEKFQRIFNEEIKTTMPLIPIVITLNPSDYILLTKDKRYELEKIGLILEEFGSNSYKVIQIPTWLKEYDEKEYVDDLINQIIHKDYIDVAFLRKHTIATMSCKASLKAHDYLNISEMQFLLDNLYNCENPSCCPHGRPTIISFTKYQLEKLFKRTGV
ncbi:MAG: DNA mismatch repair endonuclease MutL [Bacilli bacterium]